MNKNTWFDHPVVRRALSLLAALVIVAGLFPAVAVQAEAQYGYVNYDEVRFRRQANSTVVWAMLDTGWVVEIRDEKRSGGVDYYYVCTNIPKHTDREYYGYISQEYITLMTAEEVAQWKDKGGNGGELNTTPEENAPAVMTNYATPNNASTNYYSFDGSELKSLGLLSENTAYYVSGSSSINGEAYYIITVDGVNCYARADAMSMLTTGDGDDTPDAGEDPTPTPKPAATPKPEASSTAIGQLKIRPSGSTNIRKEAKVNTNNVLAQAEQGDILPYYATSVINGSRWYYVYHAPKDVFGYVLGTCVTLVDNDPTVPTAKPSTPTPVPGSGYVVLTAGGVNLREEASMSSEVLGRFDKVATV